MATKTTLRIPSGMRQASRFSTGRGARGVPRLPAVGAGGVSVAVATAQASIQMFFQSKFPSATPLTLSVTPLTFDETASMTGKL